MNTPGGKSSWNALILILALTHVIPGRTQTVEVLVDWTQPWGYDQTGRELGTAWKEVNYSEDALWLGPGAGLLGLEPDTPSAYTRHAPIGTTLQVNQTVTNYYFRTWFDFSGSLSNLDLVATNLIDDGAVFYLNGVEVGRIRVPPNQNAATVANGMPPLEGGFEKVSITNLNLLRQGRNLMAVEVHQSSSLSSDVMFGMRLVALRSVPLQITQQPQSQLAVAGEALELFVGVSGTPVSYQWWKDGVRVPTAVGPKYSIPLLLTFHAGNYVAVVSNALGVVTSAVATVTVLPDTVGPRLVEAIGDTNTYSSRGGQVIALAFNEPLFFQPPPDIRVYTGFNYTTRVAVTNMTYAFTDRPRIFLWISGFVWGEDYLVVINDVYDARRNVIFPNTRIGVSWPSTTILVPLSSLWDFHNSYVFDRSIYSNSPPWYARDYSTTSSAWWARGSGLFAFSTALPTTFCETLPSFTTISFQPEPVLFRHSFVAPPGVKSNATLLLTYNVVNGLVLYLNGVEIHQFNSEPTPVTASSRALTNYSGNCRFRIAVNVSSLLPGTNWLAAAVLNLDQAIQTVFGLSVDLYSLPTSPVPPDPPHDQCLLTIAPEGPNLRLSWPIDFSGYGLQYKTNLNPNLPWLTISNQANPYRAPQTEETRFYRLSKGGLQ